MQKARVTLSFDDGRKDTYYIFKEILFRLNIEATLNVPIGYIQSGYDNYKDVGYNGLMTKMELDEIIESDLVEIANHGFWHSNENKDIKKGMCELKKIYPNKKIIGFASPHSELNKKMVMKNKSDYKSAGISYVRIGRKFGSYNFFMRFLSYIAKKTESNLIFKLCYYSSLNNEKAYVMYSVPIVRETTLEQVKTLIQYAIKNKKWVIFTFHGIDQIESEEYKEIYCWDIRKFERFCRYIIELRDENLITIENANNTYL